MVPWFASLKGYFMFLTCLSLFAIVIHTNNKGMQTMSKETTTTNKKRLTWRQVKRHLAVLFLAVASIDAIRLESQASGKDVLYIVGLVAVAACLEAAFTI